MSLLYQSSIRHRTIASSEEDFPSQGEQRKPPSSEKEIPGLPSKWDLFATLAGLWEDSVMDNIDEEFDRLVEHLHDCAKKAESFKTTKKCLSPKTLELIRQRGAARAAGNQELTSELARLCREAIKQDLKERRAEVLAEAAEAGKSIRYARRDFASHKTRMTALRNPKGTASRRGMEKIIYDFYSDLFDSHVHLPPHHLREDGQVIPEVLPSEIRHAILPPVLICRNARFLNSGRPARPCCCIKREIHMTSATIAQSAYCPSSTDSRQIGR
ncbi:hypothetical protein RB195_009031 [Necator americanus]|uniref:Uncharacterized protein n=1 Tax=Necator americanus TaxID=51031 RepID=A0ABR1CS87_NECAM